MRPVRSSREESDAGGEDEEGLCTWIMSVMALRSWWWRAKPKLRSWVSRVLGFTKSGSFLEDLEMEREEEEDKEVVVEEERLFFLEPPPTGMLRRDPPSVQYLLHVLQKYLGWERL